VADSALGLVVLGWLSVIGAGAVSISRQDSPPAALTDPAVSRRLRSRPAAALLAPADSAG
jgi:hypothetical protein